MRAILLIGILLVFTACKDETKVSISDINEDVSVETDKVIDSIKTETIEKPIKKSVLQIKNELTAKGFKVFEDINHETQDTILMQQYFIVFLKNGPIRGQNEEETAELQKEHMAHLTKMYELGYADLSGPIGDDGDIRGIAIYNVPTLKMADSLANSDPMVKAGRLEVEIHPWWSGKGFPLR